MSICHSSRLSDLTIEIPGGRWPCIYINEWVSSVHCEYRPLWTEPLILLFAQQITARSTRLGIGREQGESGGPSGVKVPWGVPVCFRESAEWPLEACGEGSSCLRLTLLRRLLANILAVKESVYESSYFWKIGIVWSTATRTIWTETADGLVWPMLRAVQGLWRLGGGLSDRRFSVKPEEGGERWEKETVRRRTAG